MAHQSLGQLPVFLSQRARPPIAATAPPFIAGIAGSGTASYFVDQFGQPIMVRGYVLWGLLMNAGRWGGTWQSDLEGAVANLRTLRVNVLYTEPLGNNQNGGLNNDGSTWDGVAPFTSGNPATFNDTFWQRSDYLFDLCAAAGITVFFNLAYSDDLSNAGLSSFTTGNFTSYGASLGARYKNRPNLVWMMGGDYFDDFNTGITAMFTAITGQGDTHLRSVQNYPETTSRKDLESGTTAQTGTDNARFNFVYTYNVTYLGIEAAMSEASPIPVVWGDGHFDQGSGDRKTIRDLLWWALSSGARGNIYGDETTWAWTGSALANMTANVFTTADQPHIWDLFSSLRGWHKLAPDTDNSLLSSGRGSKGDYVTGSGGGGGEYNNVDTPDTYVTGSVTADGRLAVIYFPASKTLTITPTEMAAGYTARWVDPASGASTPISTASTYTPSGNNSAGTADWLLVLEA